MLGVQVQITRSPVRITAAPQCFPRAGRSVAGGDWRQGVDWAGCGRRKRSLTMNAEILSPFPYPILPLSFRPVPAELSRSNTGQPTKEELTKILPCCWAPIACSMCFVSGTECYGQVTGRSLRHVWLLSLEMAVIGAPASAVILLATVTSWEQGQVQQHPKIGGKYKLIKNRLYSSYQICIPTNQIHFCVAWFNFNL